MNKTDIIFVEYDDGSHGCHVKTDEPETFSCTRLSYDGGVFSESIPISGRGAYDNTRLSVLDSESFEAFKVNGPWLPLAKAPLHSPGFLFSPKLHYPVPGSVHDGGPDGRFGSSGVAHGQVFTHWMSYPWAPTGFKYK